MTCERVVIINKGRVVAEDTPDALTSRLQGSRLLSITVDGPEEAVYQKVSAISGVARIDIHAADNGARTFQIETTQGQDIRRELARTVVDGGFGLLELKQAGMSLEDIYLQLTTSEEMEDEVEQPPDADGQKDSAIDSDEPQ